MKVVALVPARAGSKSVPRKNLKMISGQSLLEISVSSARRVGQISEVFVSSDSAEILALANLIGFTAITRPAVAADDFATADDVVRDFIGQLSILPEPPTIVIYLQPTSPFRENEMIQNGLDLYLQNSNPVVAVTEVQQHPMKTLTIDSEGFLKEFISGGKPTANRQSLPAVFIPSGSLYIFSVQDFQKANTIPVSGATPLPVSGIYAIDIDTELDLRIAQMLGNDNEF